MTCEHAAGGCGVACQTRARAPRVRDAWRKFTEIYRNPRAGATRTLCVNFFVTKYTVLVATKFSIQLCVYYALGCEEITDVGTFIFR